jgi:hypothetical protein
MHPDNTNPARTLGELMPNKLTSVRLLRNHFRMARLLWNAGVGGVAPRTGKREDAWLVYLCQVAFQKPHSRCRETPRRH